MSNALIPTTGLLEALNEDGEFRRNARYWTGSLDLIVDESHNVIKLSDGQVEEISSTPDPPAAGRVRISAPESDWRELVRPLPKPFYLEYYSASQYHGFELAGDEETLWAYYGAILRTAWILRELVGKEEV